MTNTPDTLEVFLTDPNAILRGKWLPGSAADKLERGVAFPFSLMGVDVWGREVHETGLHIDSGDKDALCLPVEGRTVPVPWSAGETMQAMLTMRHADHTPFMGDPRNVLERQVEKLKALGMTAQVAVELEFYAIETQTELGQPHPKGTLQPGPDQQNMYGLQELDSQRAFLDAIQTAARVQNLTLDALVSEAAPGQFEVNLTHTDPLSAADDAVMLKRLIEGVAASMGEAVTFMAKPFADQPGNGMHIHASVLDSEGNIFGRDGVGESNLHHAVQGLLSTMEEGLLAFAHTFNGFRRMEPGSYAPASLSWGENNRSVAIRIPQAVPAARRIEHRLAGADANPYIVTALVLAGIAKGLQEKVAPPPPVEANAYTDGALKALNGNMGDAISAFSGSSFVSDALGQPFQHIFTALKAVELGVFANEVSNLEYSTFL